MCTKTNTPWKKPPAAKSAGATVPTSKPAQKTELLSCWSVLSPCPRPAVWLAEHSSTHQLAQSKLGAKLPNHGGMLTASGIFLLLMNITLSYGREKEVSKWTCKYLKDLAFSPSSSRSLWKLEKVHYPQSLWILYCSTKYNWIPRGHLHVRRRSMVHWFPSVPLFPSVSKKARFNSWPLKTSKSKSIFPNRDRHLNI